MLFSSQVYAAVALAGCLAWKYKKAPYEEGFLKFIEDIGYFIKPNLMPKLTNAASKITVTKAKMPPVIF